MPRIGGFLKSNRVAKGLRLVATDIDHSVGDGARGARPGRGDRARALGPPGRTARAVGRRPHDAPRPHQRLSSQFPRRLENLRYSPIFEPTRASNVPRSGRARLLRTRDDRRSARLASARSCASSAPGFGALFGGCGLGAAIEVLERVTGRPLVVGDRAVPRVRPPAGGRRARGQRGRARPRTRRRRACSPASTARRSSPWSPRSAGGRCRGRASGPIRPEVPAARREPAPTDAAPQAGTIVERLEMRARERAPLDELDGTPGDGRSALWVRLPSGSTRPARDARDRRRLRAVRASARRCGRRCGATASTTRCAWCRSTRPSGSSPTSACTRSPTGSATGSCTSGPRTAHCSRPRASRRSSRMDPEREPDDRGAATDMSVPAALRHHRALRRRAAPRAPRAGTRSSPRSATPTSGRPKPAATTRSRRSRSPPRGRRRCDSAPRSCPSSRAAPRRSRSPSPRCAQAAPGRFALGIGTSSRRHRRELERHPVREALPARPRHDPLPPRRARGREGHRRLRDVLGARASASAPRSTEMPPILVAALRPGMLRLAGREGDGAIINWLSADDVRTVVPARR